MRVSRERTPAGCARAMKVCIQAIEYTGLTLTSMGRLTRLQARAFASGERRALEQGADMSEDRGMSRRKVIGLGAATLASTTLGDLVGGPANAAALTGGASTPGIGYFGRFGVDER